MLRIGLTGGIGAGKSTVSQMLVDNGAVLIDADRIAREVVAPGEPLLAELAEAFGPGILAADGGLDRAGLAAAAFVDAEHTNRLNGLMHPAIRERTAEHFARHADAEVVVHDVPLLVENRMTPSYHLNLLVDVPARVRLDRLVETRGMDRADAESRICRQATDDERRAACDVLIDNSGTIEDTREAVDDLLESRIRPFAENLRAERRAPRGGVELVDPGQADWPAEAERLIAKLRRGTEDAFAVEHIGSTAVPDLPAKDVIDLQLLVPDLATAETLAPVLARLGYPGRHLEDHLGGDRVERKLFHANSDPGRAVNLHVRTIDSVGARFAREFRDLLIADAGERRRYAQLKARAIEENPDPADPSGYAEAKEPYFLPMRRRLVPGSFDASAD